MGGFHFYDNFKLNGNYQETADFSFFPKRNLKLESSGVNVVTAVIGVNRVGKQKTTRRNCIR